MNKRIKELLPTAENKNKSAGLYTEAHMIRFAETVIRECLSIDFKLGSYDEFSIDDKILIKQIIKEYFGV